MANDTERWQPDWMPPAGQAPAVPYRTRAQTPPTTMRRVQRGYALPDWLIGLLAVQGVVTIAAGLCVLVAFTVAVVGR